MLKCDIEIANRVFIVGPNASGKSNFLDCLRFLNDITKTGGGLVKALADRGGLKKIRALSARSSPEVEIRLELQDIIKGNTVSWIYRLSLRQEGRSMHRTLISSEVVKKRRTGNSQSAG